MLQANIWSAGGFNLICTGAEEGSKASRWAWFPFFRLWVIIVIASDLLAVARSNAEGASSLPHVAASDNPQSAIHNPQSEMPPVEPRTNATVPSPGDYRIDNWTTDQGLPQNTVQCLLQTHDGYLWIGTQSGLARYDGLRFTVFDRNNTPAFKTDNVLCLAEGAHDTLWIGTANGLLRLQDHTFTYFSTAAISSDLRVFAICPNSTGGVWLGACVFLATLQDDCLWPVTNLQASIIQSLFQDSSRELWVGAAGGLLRRGAEPGDWRTIYRAPRPERLYGASGVCQDGHGNVWFGNETGLWRYRDGQLDVYRTEHGLSPGIVSSIAEDGEGALWLAVGRHVNRFNGGQFSRFDSKTGLPDDEMRCVCADHEGNIWVGTARSGLARLRPRTLVTYTAQDGLVSDDVWSICEGRAGEMWFGTWGGVSRFADERFTSLSDASAPVFQDQSGTVWLGMKGGLARLQGDKPELFAPKEWPLFDRVSSFFQDRAGAIWVTVERGLWRLGSSRCELYALSALPGAMGLVRSNTIPHWVDEELGREYFVHTNALPGQSTPLGILEDHAGNLWVGSKGSGLHCFRDGRFSTLTTSNGLTSGLVAPLLADPDGTLWIGSDKGLNRFSKGHITRYTTAEGLAENIVGNLLEDDDGWFWTLGHHGIHRMRKQDLTEMAEGKRRAIRAMSYGTAEGMLSSEGNVGLFPNTCQTPDGLLWFPTTRGVVMVDHNQMLPRDRPAPVVLEQVLADDELIFGDGAAGDVSRRLKSPLKADKPGPPPGSQLATINHQLAAGRARLLEFRYTANTFIAPEQVQFRYQLVGHDPDWRDAGLRRTAIYTDIRPGTYRFRVVAINYHGVESEVPAEFAFSLAPFFYQTRWFYGASTLAVLLTGLGLHRLRVGRLARRQTLEQQLALALQRERIAKDMHDDLGASLTQIGLLSEHARRDPHQSPEVAADLKKIAEATRQTAQAADEMVWVVSPRHDSLESLATYLCQLAREYLEPSGIRCRLEVPETLPDVRVPSDVRHNLALFVKEALNNAVKHSAARQVSVALQLDGRNLTISVTDDGCGFDPQLSTPTPQPSATGNGLANLRNRVEELGGQFELWTHPGQGTRVGATVKLVG
jgi:ligand-binding sensor domain-containing protein/signal transduction histidine kinase